MSRKRGKNKKAAVPEEVLAEGSGPNHAEEVDAQSLADAASDALTPTGASVEAEIEAAAMAVEARVIAGDREAQAGDDDAALASDRDEDATVARGRKTKPRGKRVSPTERDDEASAADEVATADDADAGSDDGDRDEAMSASDGIARVRKTKTRGKPSDRDEALTASDAVSAGDRDDDDDPLAAASDRDPVVRDREDEDGLANAVAEASVEDAVMRAEAEAELGSAEDIEEVVVAEDDLGAALPTTAANMDADQLKKLVEALVFASDKPVTLVRLRQLTRVGDVKRLEQALAELAVEFSDRGISLQQVSGGYQFRTNTQYSVWVQQLIAGRPVRLSRAQLETLAIIAYRQPITRPEVDEIRGVDSSATLRLLLDRGLIRILGKKEEVGRPLLYGTTKEFLDFFSLGDLRELPTLREYSELTAESRKVMSDRLGVGLEGETGGEEGTEPMDASSLADALSESLEDDAMDSSAFNAASEHEGLGFELETNGDAEPNRGAEAGTNESGDAEPNRGAEAGTNESGDAEPNRRAEAGTNEGGDAEPNQGGEEEDEGGDSDDDDDEDDEDSDDEDDDDGDAEDDTNDVVQASADGELGAVTYDPDAIDAAQPLDAADEPPAD